MDKRKYRNLSGLWQLESIDFIAPSGYAVGQITDSDAIWGKMAFEETDRSDTTRVATGNYLGQAIRRKSGERGAARVHSVGSFEWRWKNERIVFRGDGRGMLFLPIDYAVMMPADYILEIELQDLTPGHHHRSIWHYDRPTEPSDWKEEDPQSWRIPMLVPKPGPIPSA